MLRRSWLPLCISFVLGTSVVSLLAAPSRHRSDSSVHKRVKHSTSSPSPTTRINLEGPSQGARSGGTASTSSDQPSGDQGLNLHGIKEWWLDKVTHVKRSLGRRAPSGPSHKATSGNGKVKDPAPSGGTGISFASGGTGGTVPPSTSAGGSSKKRGGRGSASGSGGGSGTAGTPAASGSGGGSGGSGSGSGSGSSGSGSGSGGPASGPVAGAAAGSGNGGGTSSGSGGGSAGDSPPSGETRDPAYWPFAATSPWNYPIGSNAQYADFAVAGARRPAAGTGMKLGMDANTSVTWVGQPADPVRTWSYGSSAVQMHIPDNAAPTGGESLMTFVDVGHLYAQDSYGSGRSADGNWRAGGALVNVLLKGSGHGFDGFSCLGPNQPPDYNWCLGQTRAAGVSLFAGAVRPGELTNGIRHALSLIVGREYLRRSPGHVWPAEADDGADGYTGGPACNYSLGQLVAIPLSVDVESLPLVLPQSRNIARALQRYGAYSVDTSGGLFDVVVDFRAISEWWSWLNDPNWAHDMYEVIGAQLRIVTNGFDPTNGRQPRNGVKLDGGDGTLSAPLAPPFDR